MKGLKGVILDGLSEGTAEERSALGKESQSKSIEVKPRSLAQTKEIVGNPTLHEPEEVPRLEAKAEANPKAKLQPPKVQNRPAMASVDEQALQEVEWGDSSDSKSYSIKWLLIGGITVFAIIISIFVLYSLFESNTAQIAKASNLDNGVKAVEKDPEQWFNDRRATGYKDALEVLNAFSSAKTGTERSRFVRNPEFYLEHSSEIDRSLNHRIAKEEKQNWNISHVGDTAYLRLVYKDEDFNPFSAYFTQDGESLKLDVAASAAWSEVSLANQPVELNEGEVAIVRCLISRKEEFYSSIYNDQDHASYLLRTPDKLNDVWGYVERGSDLDNKLKAVLDHGSFVVSLKKNVRVTIKLSRNNDSLSSQVDILELLHKEWVTP